MDACPTGAPSNQEVRKSLASCPALNVGRHILEAVERPCRRNRFKRHGSPRVLDSPRDQCSVSVAPELRVSFCKQLVDGFDRPECRVVRFAKA